QTAKQQFEFLGHSLDTVSPLATLQRGYAIVTKGTGNKIIRSSNTVKAGDKVVTRLAQGKLFSTIDKTES
ncbi:MAG: exodeoxyribonuclease VII large subunit, partial [Thioalkalispiraceae bacterium]